MALGSRASSCEGPQEGGRGTEQLQARISSLRGGAALSMEERGLEGNPVSVAAAMSEGLEPSARLRRKSQLADCSYDLETSPLRK